MPLSRDARTAIDVYLRHHPMAGDVPLVPSNAEAHQPCGKILAGRWLRKAEKLAEVPKLARGAWHPFRRQCASERRQVEFTKQFFRIVGQHRDYRLADGGLVPALAVEFDFSELGHVGGFARELRELREFSRI